MGNEDHTQGRRAMPGAPVVHLFFQAEASAVRRALETAMAVLRDLPLAADRVGAVEIVLAEVLNNVVEHAYAERGQGLVELEVLREATALSFRIGDDGREMPQGMVPPGAAHDLDVRDSDLPEGGFGWFLIHELTEDLVYRRLGPRNVLTFRIVIGGDPAGR